MNVPKLRFKEFDGEWERVLLGEISNITKLAGFEFTKYVSYSDKGSIIALRGLNVKKGLLDLTEVKYIDGSDFTKLNRSKLFKNDILFTYVGTIGDAALVDMNDKYYLAPNVCLIRPLETGSSSFLLEYILREEFKRKIVDPLVTISSQPSLSMENVRKFSLNIPSLDEQKKISEFVSTLNRKIQLQQQKIDLLQEQKKGFLQKMFPKAGEKKPQLRFAGFTDDWELRKLGDEFEKVNERNDGSFGRGHWISVARMYFQDPDKVQSNNIETRTYVMREGDIAFEGHPNSEFKFGRFVANDIGAGVVSELFPVYRHKQKYDNYYWKNAIQIEKIMAPIFSKSITSSGNSSNKLNPEHFLRQKILVPNIEEQQKIGSFFKQLDDTIALHQQKLDLYKEQKKGFMQQMFI